MKNLRQESSTAKSEKMSTKESDITAAYGLAKGTYRLVLNASKEQLNTVVYERKY